MIEVINRQRRRTVRAQTWREFGENALSVIRVLGTRAPSPGTRQPDQHDATIVFVSDLAMKGLNQRFRGKNSVTDVLSFPNQAEAFEDRSSLGEVVISLDRAAIQAKQNGLTLTNELQQLILHGLLHLCGYDHETDQGEMNRLELKLRKKLRI